MSTPNKDEVEGKWEQVKGSVKDTVGEATGNKDLEAEGEVEHAKGEAKENWGQFKRGVNEAADAVSDAFSNDNDN